jgi:hypothetical protein
VSGLFDTHQKLELRGIGEGGMGVVRLGRQVALGRGRGEDAPRATQRPRDAEDRSLGNEGLKPNVVPVYDIAIGEDGVIV